MTRPASLTPTQVLGSLLDELERSPADADRRIRALLNASHQWFIAAAVPLLKVPRDSRGWRYLVMLLSATGLLPDCLCDRFLTLEEASGVARMAAAAGHDLDLAIARRLAQTRPGADSAAARLLEIMDAVMRGTRTVELLTCLLDHPNPRIRSKAALLIGRAAKNARWAERHLGSPDARVRANAVEALWHGDTQSCRPVFRDAARDSNCRVAGNGALGLYLLGESESVGMLADMAAHLAPEFRAAAAWSIGETQDPRFLPLLNGMLRDREGKVRHNVLRAMARIRQNLACMQTAEPLRVEIAEAEDTRGGWRRLRVAVADSAGADPGVFPATRFAITKGGVMVREFEVAQVDLPEKLAVGFAVPHSAGPEDPLHPVFQAAVEEAVRLGRPGDCWGVVEYAPETAEEAPGGDETPAFSRQPAALGIEHGLPRAIERLLRATVPARSSRHLIVIGDPGTSAPAEPDAGLNAAAAAARAAGATVHTVMFAENGERDLRRLAGTTGGRLLRVRGTPQIPTACARICLGLLSRYAITFHVDRAAPGEIVVQVNDEAGRGEASRLSGKLGEPEDCVL